MAQHALGFLVIVFVHFACDKVGASESSYLEEQLRVLSKQVTTLLDRRREDLQSIEDSLRKKLFENTQLVDIQSEVQNLRREIELLRRNNGNTASSLDKTIEIPLEPTNKEKNEQLTVKWLSSTVTELKIELVEMQAALNATVILQNHEQVDSDLDLLKSNVATLNKELQEAHRKNAKYEAMLQGVQEELTSVRDHSSASATICGRTKNQLKAAQLEWAHNWKLVDEIKATIDLPSEALSQDHPPRHQRILKKHILSLDKSYKALHKENDHLKTKMLKVEEEISILREYVQNNVHETPQYDRINGNEIQDFIKSDKLREIKSRPSVTREEFLNLTLRQSDNTEVLENLTKQLTNFDKLHLSMLELLENVESIEIKVDNSFPEMRKEISKLEIQLSDAVSGISLLKEDQTNTRNSVKAIGQSVSNLQDKTTTDHIQLVKLGEHVNNLIKSSSLQTSKLHDHILKSESSTLDVNTTKSTIHLVQELKSFEKEYKSIVNKLPHDCSAVSGPSGIYLISPGDSEPILAYCHEGWTTIQKRYDGSVDFNQNWNEYSNGFGSSTGEHWLGNRNLHYLTKTNCSRLQINMKDIYGKYWQANYDDFRVADYDMGFKLVVDKYQGNASDALDYQNRMEFSTVDNDRDISNTHCASNYEGGWWFSHCQHANLNGRYNLGLTWFDSSRNEWIAISQSEMRVKPRGNC